MPLLVGFHCLSSFETHIVRYTDAFIFFQNGGILCAWRLKVGVLWCGLDLDGVGNKQSKDFPGMKWKISNFQGKNFFFQNGRAWRLKVGEQGDNC